MFSRSAGDYLLCCVTSMKSEYLIYSALMTRSHVVSVDFAVHVKELNVGSKEKGGCVYNAVKPIRQNYLLSAPTGNEQVANFAFLWQTHFNFVMVSNISD